MSAPRFLVRRLEASDVQSLCVTVQASIPELSYWLPWCKADYALADAQSWIRFTQQSWAAQTEFMFGVFDASSGEIIGGTGISKINKVDRIGNIGYWVGTPYVGRGVARFAAKQAAVFGFSELGLARLEIVALTNNIASQRVAESLGATRECLARNRLYFQGKPHDALIYSLIPADLRH